MDWGTMSIFDQSFDDDDEEIWFEEEEDGEPDSQDGLQPMNVEDDHYIEQKPRIKRQKAPRAKVQG